MKLISSYSRSHKVFVENWFLPSLKDDFVLELKELDEEGSGEFMDKKWTNAVKTKSDTIIQAIKDNWGEMIVYMDVDIQFFAPVREFLQGSLGNNDIVIQLDDPNGSFCAGLFIARCNDKVLTLWQEVRKAIDIENRDQLAFNRLIREIPGIRYGQLPVEKVFGGGTFVAQHWKPGMFMHVPAEPLIHHANWVVGTKEKIAQLQYVKDTLLQNRPAFKKAAKPPVVSIITPVFNAVQYIESCLLSVIDQRFPELEHLIIDGGSTDGTMDIVKKYAGEYGHIRFISEPDKGQSDAMNKGIRLAKGRLIGILNADDFYEAGTLQRIHDLAKDQGEPLFLVGNCKEWDQNGFLKYINKPKRLKLEELLLGFRIAEHPINPSAYFYSKKLHDQVGYYNEQNHYTMDLEFILRAARQVRLRYVDEVWGNFRMVEGAKTFEAMKDKVDLDRNRELREKIKGELSAGERLKADIIKARLECLYLLRYFASRFAFYLRSPRELAGFLRRKMSGGT
jgi:glycosyltransferase involved in cell wall biosynthesis